MFYSRFEESWETEVEIFLSKLNLCIQFVVGELTKALLPFIFVIHTNPNIICCYMYVAVHVPVDKSKMDENVPFSPS